MTERADIGSQHEGDDTAAFSYPLAAPSCRSGQASAVVRVGPPLRLVPRAGAPTPGRARPHDPTPAAAPVSVAVLEVLGEIDQLSVGRLSAALSAELATASLVAVGVRPPGAPAIRRLVVDVSGMTFCAVAGLNVFSRTAHAASVTGLVWALAGLSPQLARLLTEVWPAPHPLCYADRVSAAVSIALGTPWRTGSAPRSPRPGAARRDSGPRTGDAERGGHLASDAPVADDGPLS